MKQIFFTAPLGHTITDDYNFWTHAKYPGKKTYLKEDQGKSAGNVAQERKKIEEK